jgi:hypothetical protein
MRHLQGVVETALDIHCQGPSLHWQLRTRTTECHNGRCVVLPDDVTNQRVIAFRQQPKKLALNADAVATRPQKDHSVLAERVPILYSGSWLEIPQQFRSIVLQCHLKQNRIPPAHFIVAVITDHPRVIAQGEKIVEDLTTEC